PESLIRRRNLGEPSSLFDFEEVMSIPYNNMGPPPARPPPPNNNGPPPVVRPNGKAPQSMEELCQPSNLSYRFWSSSSHDTTSSKYPISRITGRRCQ
ncbi:hypothetical protein Tco_1477551, partial [Tanacetum coccineum]